MLPPPRGSGSLWTVQDKSTALEIPLPAVSYYRVRRMRRYSTSTSSSVRPSPTILKLPADDAHSVFLSFVAGRSKTKLSMRTGQSHAVYRDRAPLFSISQILFPKKYKLRRDTPYEWPFSFVFPEWTMFDRTSEYETGPSPPHGFLTGPHTLPPTYRLDLNYSYGYVQYGLEASVGRHSKPLIAKETLTFSPSFDPSALDESMTTNEVKLEYATTRLRHEDSSRTFTELLRDSIGRSMGMSIPTAVFRIHASLPKVVVLGDSISILLAVFYDPSSTTEALPRFDIRVNRLRLASEFVVRGTHEGIFGGGKTDRTRAASKTFDLKTHWVHSPNSSSSEDSEIPTDTPLELRVHWPDDSTTLYPDFKCFSMSNFHMLQVTVTISLAAREFTHEFPASKVTILPPRLQEEDSIQAQLQAASELGRTLTPLVPPPTLNGYSRKHSFSSLTSMSNHSQPHSPTTPLKISRTDSEDGMVFPEEETVRTERGLMLRYRPPVGMPLVAPVLSSTDPLVPVRKPAAS